MTFNEYMDLNSLKPPNDYISLYLYDKGLTDLIGVENYINVTSINCNNNKLTSLKGIENLNNLTFISCDDNLLSSLSYLPQSLKELSYLNNKINYRDFGCISISEIRDYVMVQNREKIINSIL